MDLLPYLPSEIVWQNLSARDLAALARTSRVLCSNVEYFLYREHAFTDRASAVVWAIEHASSDVPETCTRALAILDKVKRLLPLHLPEALDRTYHPERTYVNTQAPYGFTSAAGRSRLTALHLAAWKGLDAVAEWLLRCGANVNCESSPATPLYLAVLNRKTSSAALLLAHGADPAAPPHPGSEDPSLTVLHLACVMGHADMVEKLLATVPADPVDVLQYYGTHLIRMQVRDDIPAIVEQFARRADFPDIIIHMFCAASRWKSTLELLRAKSRRGRESISRQSATKLLDCACVSLLHPHGRDSPAARLVVCQLLDMGASPRTGRLLLESSMNDYSALAKLLPPFLEAGLDVSSGDVLNHVSAYDKDQVGDHGSAQLEVVRMLLRHGAPIGPGTRGDALDSLAMPRDNGRTQWGYKLCGALVEHCREIPRDKRPKDVAAFLERLLHKNEWLGSAAFDVDFI